jgi:hypothetical protein
LVDALLIIESAQGQLLQHRAWEVPLWWVSNNRLAQGRIRNRLRLARRPILK